MRLQFRIVHFSIKFLEKEVVLEREEVFIPKLFILCIIIFVVKLPILFVIKNNRMKLIWTLVIQLYSSFIMSSIFVLVIEYNDSS
jgi:hypothetical protein